MYREHEPNDSVNSATIIYSGESIKGDTLIGEYDYYKITIYEESDFSIAIDVDFGMVYKPLLISESTGSYIDLDWKNINHDGDDICCAGVHIAAGTYYIMVDGYYNSLSEYVLYTYWRPWSEFESFEYDIYYSDMLE